MVAPRSRLHFVLHSALATLACLALTSCALIGPDYRRPAAPVVETWRGTADPGALQPAAEPNPRWWQLFGDPILDELVQQASQNNRNLQTAGARVLEAVARRGIAIGGLFPQQQNASGKYIHTEVSQNTAVHPLLDNFEAFQVGFDAAWEIDVWGRFRRGIEASDADLLSAVASYDDVLVTLISEVARNYIALRTAEARLAVARANLEIQQGSFAIADTKFRGGAVTQLDSLQAAALLDDTRSQIPNLETTIRQLENTLCALLGAPPHSLANLSKQTAEIPLAPATVATGLPAELLRRRPDIRRAERDLAAQSARIGVASGDLWPVFSLTGSIGLSAENVRDVFQGDSLEGIGGPSVRWAILNYGRIRNNIRVQDAKFQQLLTTYEDTVLRAQTEVENAMTSFLGAVKQVEYLERSVAAARRAVELADVQYREGAVDYTRVLTTQQFLVAEQDKFITTRGSVSLSLTALYKALGGGWQLREGKAFVPEATVEAMKERTRWGGLLDAPKTQAEIDQAQGTMDEPFWRRWLAWLPRW